MNHVALDRKHWKHSDTRFTENACILHATRFNRDLRVEDDRMPGIDENQVEYSCVFVGNWHAYSSHLRKMLEARPESDPVETLRRKAACSQTGAACSSVC